MVEWVSSLAKLLVWVKTFHRGRNNLSFRYACGNLARGPCYTFDTLVTVLRTLAVRDIRNLITFQQEKRQLEDRFS